MLFILEVDNTYGMILSISLAQTLLTGAKRMQKFSINVGNTSSINEHTRCGYQASTVATGGHVTLNCDAVGRYVSMRREGGFQSYLVQICEFIVMGHQPRTRGERLPFDPPFFL